MNKLRDLYRKHEETFGVKNVLMDVVVNMGDLSQAILVYFLTHTSLQSSPLYFDENFHKAFAKAHIALDQLIEMMGEGEKQQLLTQKHYLLNQMEMDIREKENEAGSQ